MNTEHDCSPCLIPWRLGGFIGICHLLLIFVVGGCTVGPHYEKPVTPVPARWSELSPPVVTADAAALSAWWTIFDDGRLDSLVARAIRSNKDAKIAAARVREARAQRRVVAADAYPAVDATALYTRSLNSETLGTDFGASSTGGFDATNPLGLSGESFVPGQSDFFQAGFDASWEIDLFGGVRRSVEAAEADIGAFEEGLHDTLVTLLGDVATSFLQLRGDQLRLAIARRNIETQRKTVQLARSRFEAGLVRELDAVQARAQLAVTESRVPALESSIKVSLHRLGVLLGQEPAALAGELLEEAPPPGIPPEVPAGIPSEILRRRADVRRAERELAAATARVGVAVADLFPKFSLTGSVGLQTAQLTDVAVPGSHFWSIGPSVTWPVFDAGRIRANIAVQDARQEQSLLQYENTVLTALEDVENALVAYIKERDVREALARSVEENRRAVHISQRLYAEGLVDLLNVLDSQRNLFEAEDQLAESDRRLATDLVALFKALGGGWEGVSSPATS